MRDIVYVSEGSEGQFVERAVALGYEELTCIYTKRPKKAYSSDLIKITSGLVNQKGYGDNLVLGTSLSKISKDTTLLVDNEFDTEKDFVHQRRSGLNHVQMKVCKQYGVTLLFDCASLRKLSQEKMTVIIGRMKQNAKLAKKYGVPFEVVSCAHETHEMRHAKDVAAFTRTLFS